MQPERDKVVHAARTSRANLFDTVTLRESELVKMSYESGITRSREAANKTAMQWEDD